MTINLASDLAWMDMQNNTLDFVVGLSKLTKTNFTGTKPHTPDKSS